MTKRGKNLLSIFYLSYIALLTFIDAITTWPMWSNHFPPQSFPEHNWNPSQNIIPSPFFYPPPLHHNFPFQFNNLKPSHDYIHAESLPYSEISHPSQKKIHSNHSALLKISQPSVRHVESQSRTRDVNLMLYQAPPSYDRMLQPPPSILITSRPLLVTTTKRANFVPGEVKLSSSPSVQFAPDPNIHTSGSGSGWNTAVTLQVSLRPESWKKSKRPTVTDKMRQFLPELKYYKNGLKAINPNLVKNTVEKYVLVAKKQKQTDRDMVTQPSVTVVANDLIVYPRPSSEEPARDKLPEDDWEEDSEEPRFGSHADSTDSDFDVSTKISKFIQFSTKSPSKSIDQIVAEVFATVTPTTIEGGSSESDATQEEKGLSDLFDMIYIQSNKTKSGAQEILRKVSTKTLPPEEKNEVEPMAKDDEIITAPPDVLPLPTHGVTLGYKNLQEEENSVNDTINTVDRISEDKENSSTTEMSTTNDFGSSEDEISQTVEPITVRCQGMWCHHSTPSSQPIALKSQQVQITTTESQLTNTINFVDPLLNYLGLAWPQHGSNRQSKSEAPTSTTTTVKTTTIPVKTEETTTTPVYEELHTTPTSMKDNDVVNLIPLDEDKRPNYKELKDFGHDSYASAPSSTQVSREHLSAMFNALGHGIGQVMSIVMPLAAPKRKDASDVNKNSGIGHGSIDSMDFDSFLSHK